MMTKKSSAEKTVRDIRRATRRKYSAEQKIRIVIEGLRGEDSTQKAIEVDGHSIHLPTKTGISVYPSDASNVDELLNHAITAKNYCKIQKGISSYHFYDPDIQQQSLKYLQLEREPH